jgi:hypothetical protein
MAIPLAAIMAGAGALGSLGQILTAGTRKKEQALEEQAANAPKFGGSTALDQYYQQSLQQAMTPAAQTAMYKQQQNLINRNLASGIAATNLGRRGGQGAIQGLVQGSTDAATRALAGAEQLKEQRFGRLGQVTSQKAAEDYRKFQINQMQPWETKYNLLAAKAAAAARQKQAGFQNLMGNLQTGATALGSMGKTTGGTTGANNSEYTALSIAPGAYPY